MVMANDSVRAIIIGAAGRMGQRLLTAIHETSDILLAGAVERQDHPQIGGVFWTQSGNQINHHTIPFHGAWQLSKMSPPSGARSNHLWLSRRPCVYSVSRTTSHPMNIDS